MSNIHKIIFNNPTDAWLAFEALPCRKIALGTAIVIDHDYNQHREIVNACVIHGGYTEEATDYDVRCLNEGRVL